MTIDRRFPWMRRLNEIPEKQARRSVEEICRRTECNAVYDTRSKSAFFYLGNDMQWGVCQCSLEGRWDGARIDKQVRHIRNGRRPAAMKDREMALAEQADQEAVDREKSRVEDDMRPDLIEDTKRIMDRKGMGRHYKGRALVTGSKV